MRNGIVHGMVKSHPGTATESIEDFLSSAEMSAASGERLAKAVSGWCRRMLNGKREDESSAPSHRPHARSTASNGVRHDIHLELLAELEFPKPIYVRGRTSVADLFKPGERCGIYVLHFTTGEKYAGKAVDVTRRYVGHRQNHRDIEMVSFRQVPPADIDEVEQHVIEQLEQSGVLLRNIMYTSIPKGESDFDLVMPLEDQERWLRDPAFTDD
jgi:hypothetical protein